MTQAPIAHAIVIASHAGAEVRLRKLCDVLGELGLKVILAGSAEEAAAQVLVHTPDEPTLMVVDATATDDRDEDGMVASLRETLGGLTATLPHAAPVVTAPSPSSRLVIEAVRAGAVDFVDLAAESRDGLAELLVRHGRRLSNTIAERRRIRDLRGMVEEFLRDLIKTERRSIDLEHRLELKEAGKDELTSDLDSTREPVVVIVEDDREVADTLVDELERAGVATYAYISGEDAVSDVRKLVARGDAIDLAIVDQVLPGMTGLEAIAGMREHRPRLAAILMTGHSDGNLAEHAADLGVVGYVLKPFDDVEHLVARIVEQASIYRNQTRDQTYLARIKARHEKVLSRYRQLASDLDRMG
ncbi:MAG TPA: response regulator [Kofleriaceae bacterium]|nr:response regulator [Kofleriaceae bacterium]